MGRKAKWFGAVKKVFSHDSTNKSRKLKGGLGSEDSHQFDSIISESLEAGAAPPPPPDTPPPAEAVKPRATALCKLSGKPREEAAAAQIQTAFRGYMARRALRALRGLVRLKSLIHGETVRRQATTTLRCMQTLARVQSEIHSRRIRMAEDNQALQRQLLLKRDIELERLKMGEGWDDSAQSKEKIEANMLNKKEAAIRRERALAYAFSHQWKNSKAANSLFMDPRNPHWGWSWLERWMAAKPCESRSATERETDPTSVKSIDLSGYNANSDTQKPAPHKSAATKSASPRCSRPQPEEDSRSMASIQSVQFRRQSVAGGALVRDDEVVTVLPISRVVPSYMAPTKSAKAKASRFQSTLFNKVETTPEKAVEKTVVGLVNKRLSLTVGERHNVPSPVEARRHSGPPKVRVAAAANTEGEQLVC